MAICIGQLAHSSRLCAIVICGSYLFCFNAEAHSQEELPSEKVPPPPVNSKSEPKSVTVQKVPTTPLSQPLDLSKFPTGWVQYTADKKVPVNQVWKVTPAGENSEAILMCTGEPHGYLRTEKKYQDFECTLEWRFPNDPNGNSGVLIHTGNEDKIWPNSIQVQLHGATTGSIFPLGSAMSANNLQVRDLTLSPQQWNKLGIKSQSGRITVSVNDRLLGEITGCTPTAGSISLQSEGAEIHFRKIQIRELTVTETTTVTGDGRTVIIRKKRDDDNDDDDGENDS
jgi:hypothetical protein